jgi:hypothetical protein
VIGETRVSELLVQSTPVSEPRSTQGGTEAQLLVIALRHLDLRVPEGSNRHFSAPTSEIDNQG